MVLDLSRGPGRAAGPRRCWADLGADVIKVEKPGAGKGGDDTRGWGPPWLADGAGQPTTDAAYFLCTNRNKRSLTVDMTRPEGQAILRELAMRSDVVLENFKVGGLKAYGLDYASLPRSIPSSCIARSPASARTAPTPRAPATIS
jgi:crotonobetainyl-CoA:carnitine CoA-transferase CaiB-like acyl-CoA transferase